MDSKGSQLPSRFRFAIERFSGASFSLSREGDQLLLQESESGPSSIGRQSRYSPAPEHWAVFRERVETLGVWQWRGPYDNPDIDDGTQWELQISLGGHRTACRGSNRYPPDGSGTPSEAFRGMLEAVGELLGDREFAARWRTGI